MKRTLVALVLALSAPALAQEPAAPTPPPAEAAAAPDAAAKAEAPAVDASTRKFNGVNVPNEVAVGTKTLKLNGVGLRKKFVFDVYVAALYLEKTSKAANEVISSDQPKRVVMVMLRDLDKKSISDAVRDGFESNAKDTLPALQARLDKFSSAITDVKKGERLTITYLPGHGTSVKTKSGKEERVEGKDFADALFSVWLGANPVQDSLKAGMLGAE